VPVAQREKYSPEQMEGKFFIGVLHKKPKPEFVEEYLEEYHKLIDKVQMQEELQKLSKSGAKNESAREKKVEGKETAQD